MSRDQAAGWPRFRNHLARHIELDGEERSPMTTRTVADLCGDDDVKPEERSATINTALTARVRLRDGVPALENLPRPT